MNGPERPVGDGVTGHAGQAGNQADNVPEAAPGAAESDGQEEGAGAWTAPTYEPHAVSTAGRTFDVVETNGVAQAEQLGLVGAGTSDDAKDRS